MDECDVVIVGAGFSGMYAIHRVRRLGLTLRCFDVAGGVGGTWWWNRYPGARCDIESLDYSYSFSPELEQEWDWTERYATQAEILRYAEHVADRFDLRRDVKFGTRVEAAHWDDAARRWRVSTDRGDDVSARFLVMASGNLSIPKLPEIAGIETFAGPAYHTASWPHDGVDLKGQCVAVIGTGSSGIQAIPLLAEEAAHLTVFQRTAAYSTPARNATLDPAVVAARKAHYQEHRERARETRIGVVFDVGEERAADVGALERECRFRAGWDEGTLFGVASKFCDILIDPEANELAAEFLRDRIRETVADPDTAERLLPRTFPYATKRPCLDTGYYETFNRPDVTLVDLRRTPIVAVDATGIVTTAGRHDVDAIVFATGFDAMTGPLLALDLRGTGGITLAERWADGPRTYLGLATAGFPNLFTVTGPQCPAALTNMFVSIEHHVDWIADCIAAIAERGAATIEVTADAEDGWVRHVAEVAELSLYPRADSWYTGANVAGKPRVFMPYLGGFALYRDICAAIAADDYKGFVIA